LGALLRDVSEEQPLGAKSSSQGSGVISRFSFDSEHVATPSGSFEAGGASTAPEGIAWLSIVP
jgi:hypothetical protein